MQQDFVIDIADADFEAEVLERSLQVPVLLDCWAPWCGPCKSLTPVLEKLAAAYDGRFILAKLNTDEAPRISQAMRIRSIPTVTLFIGGRPVDQFMGALPEGQVRQFLDHHLGVGETVEGEGAGDDAAPPEAGPLDVAELMVEQGELERAQAFLDSMPPEERDARWAQLASRIQLLANKPPGDIAALERRIAANGKDFEARFQLAALRAWGGDFKAAFDELLEVVLRDKAEQREKARLQLVDWFEVCPDPEIVSYGRRYLGMYLN